MDPRAELLDRLRGDLPDAVVDAVASVDRACFVPADLRAEAWADCALPIGEGQTISQPSLVARMVALAAPVPGCRALDVGTGSGYHAAVLARAGARVWSIERHAALTDQAAANLAAAGIDGVELVVGDGADGVPEHAPYDVINVAAAVDGPVPEPLLAQLADGGRMVVPVGGRGEQLLVVITRDGDDLVQTEHGWVRFVAFR